MLSASFLSQYMKKQIVHVGGWIWWNKKVTEIVTRCAKFLKEFRETVSALCFQWLRKGREVHSSSYFLFLRLVQTVFCKEKHHFGLDFHKSCGKAFWWLWLWCCMCRGEMEWMVKGRAFRSKWEGHSSRCYTNMPLVFHMATSFESFCTKWLPEGKYSVSVTKTSGWHQVLL